MAEKEKLQFLYQFDAVRPEMVSDPDAWREEDIRVASDHFSYLERATKAGIVVLAGRSTDGSGPAIVIIEVDSEAQAQAFMENDPFVRSGLMRASLHPFRAALVRGS